MARVPKDFSILVKKLLPGSGPLTNIIKFTVV